MYRTAEELAGLTVSEGASIRTAVKRMDEAGHGVVCVVDTAERLCGILTDGDFRRLVLSGVDLSRPIGEVVNRKPVALEEGTHTPEQAKALIAERQIAQLPIVRDGKITDMLFLSDFVARPAEAIPEIGGHLAVPAVIMAGGRGTRLAPFTAIFPKPLVPIGEKPVIEVIMDEYAKYGVRQFFVSVNYKAKMIKLYFECNTVPYDISYVEEEEPRGTIGALGMLRDELTGPFFVSNCDIVVKTDYERLFEHHNMSKNAITIVGSLRHFAIPYGVCEVSTSGALLEMKEKPELDFLVNTGMYLMNPEVFEFIPDEGVFDLPALVDALRKAGRSVGVYPVSQQSWIDVGQWEQFRSALDQMRLLS